MGSRFELQHPARTHAAGSELRPMALVSNYLARSLRNYGSGGGSCWCCISGVSPTHTHTYEQAAHADTTNQPNYTRTYVTLSACTGPPLTHYGLWWWRRWWWLRYVTAGDELFARWCIGKICPKYTRWYEAACGRESYTKYHINHTSRITGLEVLVGYMNGKNR